MPYHLATPQNSHVNTRLMAVSTINGYAYTAKKIIMQELFLFFARIIYFGLFGGLIFGLNGGDLRVMRWLRGAAECRGTAWNVGERCGV